MKALITGILMLTSLSSFAAKKIVNAHFSKKSVVIQIQDTDSGSTKWISTAKIGVIQSTLGCNGKNCTATKLRVDRDGLYGDVALFNEASPSLEGVFLTSFYESTLIDPRDLVLSQSNGKYIVSIKVQ